MALPYLLDSLKSYVANVIVVQKVYCWVDAIFFLVLLLQFAMSLCFNCLQCSFLFFMFFFNLLLIAHINASYWL